MFGKRYFAQRYYPQRYWPIGGGTTPPPVTPYQTQNSRMRWARLRPSLGALLLLLFR